MCLTDVNKSIYCCSVAKSGLTVCDSMNCSTSGFPYPSLSPWVCSNSRLLNQWCHPTINFSSCPQFFPSSGSFTMSQLFLLGLQSIGISASVLPMNIQDWFPLRLTGWISLQSKGLSRIFSDTTVQKHQHFFIVQLSLCSTFFIVQLSHPYMTTGKTIALTIQTFVA